MKATAKTLACLAPILCVACGANEPPTTGGGGATPMGGAGGTTGGTAGAGGSAVAPMTGSYFPMAVGNKWTYQVTEYVTATVKHPPYTKTQEVTKMEPVGLGPSASTQAFRLETRKPSGATNTTPDLTVSWQLDVSPTRVVRFRENSYAAGTMNVDVEDYWNPPRIRFDEMPNGKALTTGLSWMETYTEYKNEKLRVPPRSSECTHTETWTVLNANETLTVQGKAYATVKVAKKGGPVKCQGGAVMASTLEKHYWFARGVGKVKEAPVSLALGGQVEELMTYVVK